jgi:hypothetical protein
MLTARETAAAVAGIWRLVHLDPAGVGYFDRSIEGCARSFRVAVPVAPAYALLLLAHLSELSPQASTAHILVVETLAYVVGWCAFPLAAHLLSEAIDRKAEWAGYIAIYNWSSLLQMAVLLPLAGLTQSGLVPQGLGILLQFFGAVALLGYGWFVARTALRVGGGMAAAFVGMDLIISLTLSAVTDGSIR